MNAVGRSFRCFFLGLFKVMFFFGHYQVLLGNIFLEQVLILGDALVGTTVFDRKHHVF